MKIIIRIIFLYSSLVHAQLGIGTPTPQETLHVTGTLQVTNSLKVGGDAFSKGSAGRDGQILKSNGAGKAPSWVDIAKVPTSAGTVIVVNGEFLVAQEITVQMTANFSNGPTKGVAVPIGNLNNEIVDNSNSYLGTAKTNSFRVAEDGLYQITMNIQIATDHGTSPVIGVYDDTIGKWSARVANYFDLPWGQYQTFTLMTSARLLSSHNYAFKAANDSFFTIRHLSEGNTGSGPITQVSLKRLR